MHRAGRVLPGLFLVVDLTRQLGRLVLKLGDELKLVVQVGPLLRKLSIVHASNIRPAGLRLLRRDVARLTTVMSVTMCCMAIDPDGSEYLYVQVADDMRARCESGQWPRGHRIPGITALAAEYDVATMTIRKAKEILKAEGRLITKPGRGTYCR
jgi:hypothetical protein